ncbi:MAG: hypothetical protein GF308_13860 [Candidatus Heimdallarchaeota archaeon]|nr:hypothetical protein [Candidatus Heimdallarchaeota archaeon]
MPFNPFQSKNIDKRKINQKNGYKYQWFLRLLLVSFLIIVIIAPSFLSLTKFSHLSSPSLSNNNDKKQDSIDDSLLKNSSTPEGPAMNSINPRILDNQSKTNNQSVSQQTFNQKANGQLEISLVSNSSSVERNDFLEIQCLITNPSNQEIAQNVKLFLIKHGLLVYSGLLNVSMGSIGALESRSYTWILKAQDITFVRAEVQVTSDNFNSNNASLSIKINSDNPIRVAVLDASESQAPSYFEGTFKIDHSIIVDFLSNDPNITVSLVDNGDIRANILESYDILVLDGNAPSLLATSKVLSFWENGGGILAFNNSASFLCYSEIIEITGQDPTAGLGDFWFYEGPQTHTVRSTLHPLAAPFESFAIAPHSMNHFVSFNKGMLDSTVNSECIKYLMNVKGFSNNITAFAYEPNDGRGKISFICDNLLRLQEEVVLTNQEQEPVHYDYSLSHLISTNFFVIANNSNYENPSMDLIISARDAYGFWDQLEMSVEGETKTFLEINDSWVCSGISYDLDIDFSSASPSSTVTFTFGFYYPFSLACDLLKRKWITLENAYSITDEVPQGEIGTIEATIRNDFPETLPVHISFDQFGIDPVFDQILVGSGINSLEISFIVHEEILPNTYLIAVYACEYLREDLSSSKSITFSITPAIVNPEIAFAKEGIQGETILTNITLTSYSSDNETILLKFQDSIFERENVSFEVSYGEHTYQIELTVKENEPAITKIFQVTLNRFDTDIYISPLITFEIKNAVVITGFGPDEAYISTDIYRVYQGEKLIIYIKGQCFSSDNEKIFVKLVSQNLIIDTEAKEETINAGVTTFEFSKSFNILSTATYDTFYDLQIIIEREGIELINQQYSDAIYVLKPFQFTHNIPNSLTIDDDNSSIVEITIISHKSSIIPLNFSITASPKYATFDVYQAILPAKDRLIIPLTFSNANCSRYGSFTVNITAAWQKKPIFNYLFQLNYLSYVQLENFPEENGAISVASNYLMNITLSNDLDRNVTLYLKLEGDGGFNNSTMELFMEPNGQLSLVLTLQAANFTSYGQHRLTISIRMNEKILHQVVLDIVLESSSIFQSFWFYLILSISLLVIIIGILSVSLSIHLRRTDQTFQEFRKNFKNKINNSLVVMAIRSGKIKRLEKKLADTKEVLHQSQNEISKLTTLNNSLSKEVSLLRGELEYHLRRFRAKISNFIAERDGIATLASISKHTELAADRIKFYLEQALLADDFILSKSETKIYKASVIPRIIINFLERFVQESPSELSVLTITLSKLSKETDLPINAIRNGLLVSIAEGEIRGFFCGENQNLLAIIPIDQLDMIIRKTKQMGVFRTNDLSKVLKTEQFIVVELLNQLLIRGLINGRLLEVDSKNTDHIIFITEMKLIEVIEWVERENGFKITELARSLQINDNEARAIIYQLKAENKIRGILINRSVYLPQELVAKKINKNIHKKNAQYSFKLSYFANKYQISIEELERVLEEGAKKNIFDIVILPEINTLVSIDNYIQRAMKNWENAQIAYEKNQLRISCMDSFTAFELCLRAVAAKRFKIDPIPGKYTLTGKKNSQDYLIRTGLINLIFRDMDLADDLHTIRKRRNKIKTGAEITRVELQNQFQTFIGAFESINFTYLPKFKEIWLPIFSDFTK